MAQTATKTQTFDDIIDALWNDEEKNLYVGKGGEFYLPLNEDENFIIRFDSSITKDEEFSTFTKPLYIVDDIVIKKIVFEDCGEETVLDIDFNDAKNLLVNYINDKCEKYQMSEQHKKEIADAYAERETLNYHNSWLDRQMV